MPGIDFTCNICKKPSGRNVMGGSGTKWKCTNGHGDICNNCVSGGILSDYKCVKCRSVVSRYQFNQDYGKWLKG